MTQEEMIEQLENTILLIRQNGKDWWDERDIPVLEEAIKAMKMEQNAYKEGYDACKRIMAREKNFNHYCPKCMGKLEPCEDCISRQAAVSVANDFDATQVVRGLEKLPSVTPEQKTGHWEQYGNSWEDKFKCSECGKEQPKILCCERIIGHWSDYCPNCGAKMKEDEE